MNKQAVRSDLQESSKTLWPWPDSLDTLIAAPNHHTLLWETEQARAVRTLISPGEIVPVHTHRWPGAAFVIAWSDLIRRDPAGHITLDTRQVLEKPKHGVPYWQEPIPPHSVENVGTTEINIVQVEIKPDNVQMGQPRLATLGNL